VTADSGHRPTDESDPDDARLSDLPGSSVDALREILFGNDRQHIAKLESGLGELERRITDQDTLISLVAPVLGSAIQRRIRDAREEMVEALYPIIGQIILRAVSQALRDALRRVAIVLRFWSPRVLWQRARMPRSRILSRETAPQPSAPDGILEAFLIHRETGLLLWHVSNTPRASRDPELTREALAAIHDFRQTTTDHVEKRQRGEANLGERNILMEAAGNTCLAVVTLGPQPSSLRAKLHKTMSDVEHAYQEALLHSHTDPPRRLQVQELLSSLIKPPSARPRLSPRGKRLLVGAFCLVVIFLAGAYLAWGRHLGVPR
jgi:hypothetical protein